jgi:hypothetical protein
MTQTTQAALFPLFMSGPLLRPLSGPSLAPPTSLARIPQPSARPSLLPQMHMLHTIPRYPALLRRNDSPAPKTHLIRSGYPDLAGLSIALRMSQARLRQRSPHCPAGSAYLDSTSSPKTPTPHFSSSSVPKFPVRDTSVLIRTPSSPPKNPPSSLPIAPSDASAAVRHGA